MAVNGGFHRRLELKVLARDGGLLSNELGVGRMEYLYVDADSTYARLTR